MSRCSALAVYGVLDGDTKRQRQIENREEIAAVRCDLNGKTKYSMPASVWGNRRRQGTVTLRLRNSRYVGS